MDVGNFIPLTIYEIKKGPPKTGLTIPQTKLLFS